MKDVPDYERIDMFDYSANATPVSSTKSTPAQKLMQLTEAYRAEVRAEAQVRVAKARVRRAS